MVELVPMTSEELAKFLEASIPDYAKAHVRSGRWKESESIERSRAEHRQLLPRGVETPDHYLRTVRAGKLGERVGEVWYAFQRQEGWPQVFVYWIGIDEAHRRKGYASEAFARVEEEGRRLGATRIALHVFGDNDGARAFYAKLGYAETNVVMAKPLST